MARESADNLPLTAAELHILLALAGGERHGYAIMQEIGAAAGGRVRVGPATLYGTIKRLLMAGLISEMEERPDPGLNDERRRYYALTETGRRVLTADAERLERVVELARVRRILPGPASFSRAEPGS